MQIYKKLFKNKKFLQKIEILQKIAKSATRKDEWP